MERELFKQPVSLEFENQRHGEMIARIALYIDFEDMMQDVDNGTCTLETAIERMHAIVPHVREAAVEAEGRS